MLTRFSHMIQLVCLRPSLGPMESWVDNPSPLVKIGAQITVENREIDECLQAHDRENSILPWISSQPEHAVYSSPRLMRSPRGSA